MADFEIAWGETSINEGGYVNDPVDRGGETYRGVTRRFHPKWAGWAIVKDYQQRFPNDFETRLDDDRQLQKLVLSVYRDHYWKPIRGDELPNQQIANRVFDTGVNQGVKRSLRYLQESLNLLNRNQKNYQDVQINGVATDATLEALRAFLNLEHGQPDYLLKSLCIMQGAFYLDIMRNSPDQERFARGWLNRVGLR